MEEKKRTVARRLMHRSNEVVLSLKTCLDIIPPRNISIRPGGSAGKKVKYEEQRAEK